MMFLMLFLSTPSARRATEHIEMWVEARAFLSTPSARRATSNYIKVTVCPGLFLSTPSARRATDTPDDIQRWNSNFYPRPPRGGRRGCSHGCRYCFAQFLSTPSARRATEVEQPAMQELKISIHALREEGDVLPTKFDVTHGTFLSTPSARRATSRRRGLRRQRRISIHALREEGDLSACPRATFGAIFLSTPSARRATPIFSSSSLTSFDFYPRPPRGGRPARPASWTPRTTFLSTPSARRATAVLTANGIATAISIHALR